MRIKDRQLRSNAILTPRGWRVSIEVSLPKFLRGHNREPLSATDLRDGVAHLLEYASGVPVLEGQDWSNAILSRTDVALDLPLQFGEAPFNELFRSTLPSRNVWPRLHGQTNGSGLPTYYSRHICAGDRNPTRSICGYQKRVPVGHAPILRSEVRFFGRFFHDHFNKMRHPSDLASIWRSLEEQALNALRSQFRFLQPTSEEEILRSLLCLGQRGPRDGRDTLHDDLEDFIGLARQTGLPALVEAQLFEEPELRRLLKLTRRLGLGVAAHGVPGLQAYCQAMGLIGTGR